LHHDFTVLLDIYDENEDGNICPNEFESLYVDAENGEIPWPEDEDEEEEKDDEDEEEEKEEDPDNVTTQEEFDEWVRGQDVHDHDYYCNFDIRNHWNDGYFLWAGHNCDIYDLTLKIHFPKDAWLNRRTWTSSDMNCLSESCNDETNECEATFFITPMNPKLGLGFDDDGTPIEFRFETENWSECVDNYEIN